MWTKWPVSGSATRRAPSGSQGSTSFSLVPQPISSGSSPSTASNGIPSPTMRNIDHSGRHGPNPPKRIDGSSFHRQPSASSRAPTLAM